MFSIFEPKTDHELRVEKETAEAKKMARLIADFPWLYAIQNSWHGFHTKKVLVVREHSAEWKNLELFLCSKWTKTRTLKAWMHYECESLYESCPPFCKGIKSIEVTEKSVCLASQILTNLEGCTRVINLAVKLEHGPLQIYVPDKKTGYLDEIIKHVARAQELASGASFSERIPLPIFGSE